MFHTTWATEQQAYYIRLKSQRKGRTWLATVIREIWHIAWSVWESRNKALHQPLVLRTYEDMKEVDRDIRSEFRRAPPPSCPPQYRHFFYRRDPREILSRSNYHRRGWLTDVTNARAACARFAHSQLQQQQNLLHNWLNIQ